uniref:Dynein heavy chain C-terminal domain-containing protein n=1 Tax=Salmo trutta TaxID=8032 RepID=A0A673ZFD9_SALTR
MMGKMLKMQMLEDEDDLTYEKETKRERTAGCARCVVNHLKRTVENIKDPLFCFFVREVKMGAHMLQEVRQDLTDVVQVCKGKKKQTNDLRTLINDLVKGILPRSCERVKQLQAISQGAASGGAKELKVRSSDFYIKGIVSCHRKILVDLVLP